MYTTGLCRAQWPQSACTAVDLATGALPIHMPARLPLHLPTLLPICHHSLPPTSHLCANRLSSSPPFIPPSCLPPYCPTCPCVYFSTSANADSFHRASSSEVFWRNAGPEAVPNSHPQPPSCWILSAYCRPHPKSPVPPPAPDKINNHNNHHNNNNIMNNNDDNCYD